MFSRQRRSLVRYSWEESGGSFGKLFAKRREYSRNFSILNGTPFRGDWPWCTRIRGARIKIMRISRADISVNFFNLKFRAAVQVLPLHEEHDKWSLIFLFFFFFLELNFTQIRHLECVKFFYAFLYIDRRRILNRRFDHSSGGRGFFASSCLFG